MNIDWNKMSDATHWHPMTGDVSDHWYKPGFFCVCGFENAGWQVDNNPLQDRADYISRPVEWTGEGLPPVGTVCEIRLNNGLGNWCKATILFCQDNALVLSWAAEGVAHATTLDQVEFRLIRTAEQIAAEEREKAVEEMARDTLMPMIYPSKRKEFAYALYDAGYRKQVQP